MQHMTATFLLASMLALGACKGSGGKSEGIDIGRNEPRAETPEVQAADGGMGQPALAAGLNIPLETLGYSEKEYFLSGTARSYLSRAGQVLTEDGLWDIEAGTAAPYVTRAVVYRPLAAANFNGTVIVEWMNVTSGSDVSPVLIYTHNELIREGYVLVSLSAQAAGVESTKALDPERYTRLQHPGDNHSYDIFSQVGQAVWDHADLLLDGLIPQRVIGAGESQSSYRLVTYANAVHPLVTVYDGFLLHSRLAKPAPLATEGDVPGSTAIRPNLGVPVLVFQTEADINEVTRQSETSTYRLWEVAGTAHFDAYGGGAGLTDTGDGQGAVLAVQALLSPPKSVFGLITCDKPINAGPMNFVLSAAIHALDKWVRTGNPPATANQLQAIDFTLYSPRLERDASGNALGGIRTPFVDVPLAVLSGAGNSGGNGFCGLFGTTTPYNATELDTRYPTQQVFVNAWTAATEEAVDKGFFRPADGQALIDAAKRVQISPDI